jgi:hypothetical protein
LKYEGGVVAVACVVKKEANSAKVVIAMIAGRFLVI